MPDSLLTAVLYYFGCFAFILFVGALAWLGGKAWRLVRWLLGSLSMPLFLRHFWWRVNKCCTNCGNYPKLPGRPVCQTCSLFLLQAFGACSEYTGTHATRRPKGAMPK